MYLSKVVLHWPACRNPYTWHKMIWRLFPDLTMRNFQFSCLDRRNGCDITILLFSIEKPLCAESKEISLIGEPKSLSGLAFKPNQLLRFRLTANPTKILTEQNEGRRKIRVPLIREEQQIEWLNRHLAQTAAIKEVSIQNETPLYFSKGNKAGKIVPVLYEGLLQINEPMAFRNIIYESYEENNKKEIGRYIAGIGPAKAFGCGLMLLKPYN